MTRDQIITLTQTLAERGITLRKRNGSLVAAPKSALTPDVLNMLQKHGHTLADLLEPERESDQVTACPVEWLHLPVLPAKHDSVTGSALSSVYRVRLYGRYWRIFWKSPGTNDTVHVTRDDGLKWVAPSLKHFARIAWIESIRNALAPDRHPSGTQAINEAVPDDNRTMPTHSTLAGEGSRG